jgi:aspartate kinase
MELGRIGVRGLPKGAAVQAAMFKALSASGVMVDDIVQTESNESLDVAFTVGHADLAEARDVVRGQVESMGLNDLDLEVEIGLAKISVVGTGMRSHVGIAGVMFDSLDQAGIPIMNITTSEIRISCLIPQDRSEEGLQTLHKAFGLEQGVESVDG